MAQRAALPTAAVTITPGYSWRLDLDVKFDGERPDDWGQWIVRMHVWHDAGAFTLKPGAGVSFQAVSDLPGETQPIVIPVIRMSEEQSESLRDARTVNYLIDLTAPGGNAEDFFAGAMSKAFAPPTELLA